MSNDFIVSAIIFIGFLWLMFGVDSTPKYEYSNDQSSAISTQESISSKPVSNSEIAGMLTVGEINVKAQLKDPDSATFQNQYLGPKGHPCGEVNAKNGFGGYTGYKRYIVASKDMVAVDGTNMESVEFEDVWNLFCAK